MQSNIYKILSKIARRSIVTFLYLEFDGLCRINANYMLNSIKSLSPPIIKHVYIIASKHMQISIMFTINIKKRSSSMACILAEKRSVNQLH